MSGKQEIIDIPDVFSRGSLKLTFDLLRKKQPQLALTIRNIANGEPLPKEDGENEGRNSDHFKVEIDSYQVRAVVETLALFCQAGDGKSGQAIVARTLIEDWMSLARKMVAEMPAGDGPGPMADLGPD